MTDAWLARLTLGAIFVYHGLVPKLLYQDATELRLLDAHGLPHQLLVAAGVGEVLLGLLILLLRRRHWPLWTAMAALILLLLDVAIFAPGLLTQAFNPLSLNLAAVALCVIALRGRAAR